jgi:hypothetical protein
MGYMILFLYIPNILFYISGWGWDYDDYDTILYISIFYNDIGMGLYYTIPYIL